MNAHDIPIDRVVVRAPYLSLCVAPSERHESKRCLECQALTKRDKPYCQDHVLLNPEAAETEQTVASYLAEVAAGRGKRFEAFVLAELDRAGARTPRRLAIDCDVPVPAMKRLLRTLDKEKLTETLVLGSRRGSPRHVVTITERGREVVQKKETARPTCAEPGCEIPARSVGLCAKHYTKKYRDEQRAKRQAVDTSGRGGAVETLGSPPKRIDFGNGTESFSAAARLANIGQSLLPSQKGRVDPTPIMNPDVEPDVVKRRVDFGIDPTAIALRPEDPELALMFRLVEASDEIRERVLKWAAERWPT